MANYVLLYNGGGMAPTAEAQADIMKDWGGWAGELGSNLVDMGLPFSGKVKNVTLDGKVHEGPIGSQSSGYSIIKADDIDSAVKIAKGCPVLQGGASIQVVETFSVM